MTIKDQGDDIRNEAALTRHDLEGEMAALRGEMTAMRAGIKVDLRGEMAEMRAGIMTDLRGEMAEMREGIMTDLRGELMAAMQSESAAVRKEFRQEFERVNRSIASLDGEYRRQGVLMEALQGKVEQIAEGLLSLKDQMTRDREERAEQMSQLESLLRASYLGLDQRVGRLEQRFSS